MEENPCEAVKNNILGTLNMAEAAVRHQVDHFILISTDKAVNPTSIMGASKRVAEFIIQNMNQRNKTDFDAVRFGNVLGSNGSVIPTFLEQINERKPVTVTHPDIRRFFMSIPEAVSLILHAGAIGKGGDIFVLEMGEQIKMIDLARNLIRLAGLIPDVDVPIKFIGLRPGEKLFEELVNGDETVEPSDIEKINRIVSEKIPNFQELMFHIRELEHHAQQGDNQAVRIKLTEIVPAFQSSFPLGPESISVP
jgi:FlaA1/EpsC-like NDP-sugar epimerase